MRVVVAGASMAGLCTAYFLARSGHRVTVLERAEGLRTSGSPIDVRGPALEVADDMGILDAISANQVTSADTRAFTTFVDRDGDPVAMLPIEIANDSPEDIEIARQPLLDILSGALDGLPVTVGFGDAVSDVAVTDDGVVVTCASGATHAGDVVVGADGIHSTVRRVVFGPEADHVRFLGLYTGVVDLPRDVGWQDRAYTLNVPGRMATVTDLADRTLGWVVFRSPLLACDHHDLEAQRAIVLAEYDGIEDWRVPDIRRGFATADDFYFDTISQVHMDTWSAPRVVLVGDAGYAPSLLSGRGTSLAMEGASLLARGLAGTDDLQEAFDAYESGLRDRVAFAQDGVAEATDIIAPPTWDDIAARNAAFPVPETE